MSTLWKMKIMLAVIGFLRIPIIGFVRPKLVMLDEKTVRVLICLRRRTKNHLGSMYFGALSVGADIAGGLHAFYFADKLNKKISFSFKSMNANFIKRAESDVTFDCSDGILVREALSRAIEYGERINQVVKVMAFDNSQEKVAEFEMIISIKNLI
ncbi:MAG TPA: DUF4442 domain-containing protein [Oligoflexia bacterium]|nr:DUF4442 domain-containing protein [Oligoflexia bacterium]HMP47186.1 DUF4442 domain-containing protein [Oligoflexia bacterium]